MIMLTLSLSHGEMHQMIDPYIQDLNSEVVIEHATSRSRKLPQSGADPDLEGRKGGLAVI